MNKTDAQLVEDCLTGEEAAFEALVDRHLKTIYRFILRLLSGREEANDVTQEVFVKIWRNLKRYDPAYSFKTWMFSIARHTAIDWLRQKRALNFSDLESVDNKGDPFVDRLAGTEPWPDEEFERAELKSTLKEALSKLPVDDRIIINLHHDEGLTFEEVAEVLCQPMNTIKSRYRRALLKLRSYLTNPAEN